MSNLVFAWPYAAIGFFAIIPFWLYHRKQEGGYLISPIAQVMKKLATSTRSLSAVRFPLWPAIIWALMVLSLMRPQLVGDALEISRDGRNLMMVLDLSESMEATDMTLADQPVDRLTIAKEVMTEFIDERRGDRIGLVVFGSESFLHAPLTFDHRTIKTFLVDTQIGFAGPKTAIGDAIGLATKKLLEEQNGDRVIILLTDGQNNIGSLEPLQAAQIASKHKVKIYVIGLGASRMIVDGFFGATRINPSVSLDEAEPEMKEVTALTGGKYFRARDHQSLVDIYREIDTLEPVKTDPVVVIPRKDLFYWPLALALVVILLRMLSTMRVNFSQALEKNGTADEYYPNRHARGWFFGPARGHGNNP